MIRLTLIGKVSKFLLREGGPDKERTEVTVENLEVSRSALMCTGLRIDSSDLAFRTDVDLTGLLKRGLRQVSSDLTRTST